MSLDVDEKLPVRILNVSDSHKTILINRGLEDGLVEGDHAKFYLTTGVIARGVIVKASPSRSVWSLYRIVNGDEISAEKVMNLKITTAVKLSVDPTKMLKKYEDPLGETKEVVLTPPDEAPKDQTSVTKEMKNFPEMSENTWELWSTLHLSSLTSSNSTGRVGRGTKGPSKSLDLVFGLEKYFSNLNAWYSRLSISPFAHISRQEYTSIQGNQIHNNLLGYGLGAHYHFLEHPLSLHRFLLWANVGFGVGKASDSVSLVIDTSSTSAIDTPVNLTGAANFYFLGAGMKYNFHPLFGVRMTLDYYVRAESYKIQSTTQNGATDPYTKRMAGFRFLVGPSFRFF